MSEYWDEGTSKGLGRVDFRFMGRVSVGVYIALRTALSYDVVLGGKLLG